MRVHVPCSWASLPPPCGFTAAVVADQAAQPRIPTVDTRRPRAPTRCALRPQVVFSRPVIALGSDFMGGSAEHLVSGSLGDRGSICCQVVVCKEQRWGVAHREGICTLRACA